MQIMKNILTYALLLSALIGLCLLLYQVDPSNSGVSEFQADAINYSSAALNSWQPLINFSHNGYHMWRFDSHFLEIFIPDDFNIKQQQAFYIIFAATIFCLGLTLLLKLLIKDPALLRSSLTAFFLTLSLLIIIGFDSHIFGSISYFPWVVMALYCAATGCFNQRLLPFLTLFLALRVTASANQSALPVIIFGAVLSYVLIHHRKKADPLNLFSLLLNLLILLLPSLITAFLIPEPPIGEYPYLSRVVPDDGIRGSITPLIDAYGPVITINRNFIKASYFFWPVVAFVFLLLSFVKHIKSMVLFKAEYIFLFLVCLFIGFDLFLTESMSQIAPVATLNRILPNHFLVPLTPLICVLLSISLIIFLSRTAQTKLAALFILILTLWPHQNDFSDYSLIKQSGSVQDPYALKAYRELLTAKLKDRTKLQPARYQMLTLSPSYWVINQSGLWLAESKERFDNLKALPFDPSGISIQASHNRALASKNILDSDPTTRWSPRTGKQDGSEWLLFKFNKLMTLDALELLTGNFFTDFPNGIAIAYSQDCSKDSSDKLDLQNWGFTDLLSLESWQGSIEYTNDGFPFFAGQSNARILLPETIETRCLLVKQTGKAPVDWSVVGVKFYKAQKEL